MIGGLADVPNKVASEYLLNETEIQQLMTPSGHKGKWPVVVSQYDYSNNHTTLYFLKKKV